MTTEDCVRLAHDIIARSEARDPTGIIRTLADFFEKHDRDQQFNRKDFLEAFGIGTGHTGDPDVHRVSGG